MNILILNSFRDFNTFLNKIPHSFYKHITVYHFPFTVILQTVAQFIWHWMKNVRLQVPCDFCANLYKWKVTTLRKLRYMCIISWSTYLSKIVVALRNDSNCPLVDATGHSVVITGTLQKWPQLYKYSMALWHVCSALQSSLLWPFVFESMRLLS